MITVIGCTTLSEHAIIPGERVGRCRLAELSTMSDRDRRHFETLGVHPYTSLFDIATCQIWVTNPEFSTRPGHVSVGDPRSKVLQEFGTPRFITPPDGKISSEFIGYQGIGFEIVSNVVVMITVSPKEEEGQSGGR